MRQSSRMASVDVDFDAHPGAQGWQILIARLNPYSHRNALDNLHPVPARILGGQKRELLRSRWTHALHGAAPLRVGIRIHGHKRRLAWADISQLSFLRIGDDPSVIRGDEIKSGH